MSSVEPQSGAAEVAPYTYPTAGQVIVVGDGPELLVYSAANDQGMWKVMADDILMGVGAFGDQVLSIDGGGLIVSYRSIDGHENYRLETDCSPMGMQVSPQGLVAIVTASSLMLVAPGQPPLVQPWPTPRHVAWAPNSESLGVGSADGTFAVVDPASLGAWGTVNLGSAVTGVAPAPAGGWAVAHGQQVSFVSPDGTQVTDTLPVSGAVSGVSLSQDGAVLVAIVGGRRVAVYELHTRQFVGEITYQRHVSAVQFGPGHWLGIGFDQGDANRLDVVGGTMTRTQAHPGRAQNGWAMQAQISHSKVRGAVANVATGGSAIAVANKVKAVKKKRKMWPIVVGLLAVAGIAGFMFCGGGALFYYIGPTW
ncbi:MAG: hypothetical protein AB8H79_09360 [Myxococcota bacterium]